MQFPRGIDQIAGTTRERSALMAATAVALTVVACIAVVSGGGCRPAQPEITITASPFAATAAKSESPTAPSTSPTPTEDIVVYVTGAVKKPGVYTLRAGARIYQAIDAAGGFQKDAIKDAINLADWARDSSHISVPARIAQIQKVRPAVVTTPFTPEEPAEVAMESSSNGSFPTHRNSSTKFKNPGDGMVNLNTATAADLEKLPGIGPAMSTRILAYRQMKGGFHDTRELVQVPGIGAKKFEKMAPFILVD